MTFYQAMQLGPNNLQPLIKEAKGKKLKRKYITAFILKNFLCLLFCMIVVTIFSMVFGTDNSIVGVVTVMALLTFRFAHLDFKVRQSAVAILGIFAIFIISPYLLTIVNPLFGLVVNFISIVTIVVLACHDVKMSNQSTLIVSYLLLYGYKTNSIEVYTNRIWALVLGGIIVSTIFYFSHRKMSFENNILNIIKDVDFTTSRSKWQLKFSLAISIVLLIGEFLNIPRVMWMGLACMSILQPNKEKLEFRVKARPLYMIIGCLLFAIIYSIMPKDFKLLIGLIGGFASGFCATYQWQTSFNCLGALVSAVPIFGLGGAIIIRIIDNALGAIYTKFFNEIFDKIDKALFINNNVNEAG